MVEDTPDPPQQRTKTSQVSGASSDHHGLLSADRSISPPLRGQKRVREESEASVTPESASRKKTAPTKAREFISSPIRLVEIQDLPKTQNVDTVNLHDLLGDPLIKECWQFNYCFDVNFVMNQFDEDVRALVNVKIVHGSWKKDSPNRISIQEACARWKNAQEIVAYMPEMFGTHHSKMMILIRHDDTLQIIIHTANMIPQDWTNMCQAVWQSPMLPLTKTSDSGTASAIGSGARFKKDLLAYLRAYGSSKTGQLTKQLRQYDFSQVKAALVASVPSKDGRNVNPETETLWGWRGLRNVLKCIPTGQQRQHLQGKPHIVAQISSVATLGATNKWLNDTFLNALSVTNSTSLTEKPKVSIIFPTADEIRHSLDGYISGGSIHWKIKSAQHRRQLEYIRPMLCHWAGDDSNAARSRGGDAKTTVGDAGRRRAAPHIKTYIRFSDASMTSIDWAMVTSANLSTQAWGASVNATGQVRICSFEIGVVVWPDLFKDETNESVKMVPVFGKDTPATHSLASEGETLMGLRMPYDLPLVPYDDKEEPWCATRDHDKLDWKGMAWKVE